MKNLTKTEIDRIRQNNHIILHFDTGVVIEGDVRYVSEEIIIIRTDDDRDLTYCFENIIDFECFSHKVEKKNYESNDNMVSHPPHYQSATGLEVIDVIEAFTADLTGIEAVDTANAIKYICRWKHKNGLQDLKKAMWYLQREIDRIENK